jgi:hypothetical protein
MFTDISEVFIASIIRALMMVITLMMEVASITETSVNFNEITRRNIPEE